MAGEVEKRHLAIVGEQFTHGLFEHRFLYDVVSPSANHEPRAKIDRTVGISIQQRFDSMGVVDASSERTDIFIMIDPYNESLPHAYLV
jgi:hypothetical protein